MNRYGTIVHYNAYPPLQEYIESHLTACKDYLLQNQLEKLSIVVFNGEAVKEACTFRCRISETQSPLSTDPRLHWIRLFASYFLQLRTKVQSSNSSSSTSENFQLFLYTTTEMPDTAQIPPLPNWESRIAKIRPIHSHADNLCQLELYLHENF